MPVSQFNHKQPTRFNEPEIPFDLATKQYVDDRSASGNPVFRFKFGQPPAIAPQAAVRFAPHVIGWVGNENGTVETDWQITTFQEYTLRRVIGTVFTNARTESAIYSVRDDAVSVGTITVAAGLVGSFDSGDLTAVIASGSGVCWLFDYRVGTGNITSVEIVGMVDP